CGPGRGDRPGRGLRGCSRLRGARRFFPRVPRLAKGPAAALEEEAVQILRAHHRRERALAQLLWVDHEGIELLGGEAAVRAELERIGHGLATGRCGAEQDDVAGAAHAQKVARVYGGQRMPYSV